MELYKIGEENGVKVYKKTCLGNIAIVIICVLLLLSGIFFGTTCYYRSKFTGLMERNRVELEIARARAEQYEEICREARETNNELGECIQRSSSTLSELREQIHEIRRKYEKMESVFNSIGNNNNNSRNNDINILDIASE